MVEIPDVEPEVFQELLRYIYTDQLPNKQLDEIVVELLAVAYKCCPNFVLTSHRYENHEVLPSTTKNKLFKLAYHLLYRYNSSL